MVLYICLRSYKTGWILIGFGVFFGIILYGAHAFGILMENARNMGKGNLETKVSDRFLVGAFRDFAGDLNALADVAKVAAQEQMKSERMKTELITNVSHDIKTPLTSIINYVDLLEKPHTAEEEQQYLEVLGRKSQQLKKLIGDLTEMSKASSGSIAVNVEWVDAAEAINQALGEFADKLELCHLTPVFNRPEERIRQPGKHICEKYIQGAAECGCAGADGAVCPWRRIPQYGRQRSWAEHCQKLDGGSEWPAEPDRRRRPV